MIVFFFFFDRGRGVLCLWCCGYGGIHTPEHRPVGIIYTLLFCKYAKTLPEPLGRLHLKRSRTGLSSSDLSSSTPFARWMQRRARRVPVRCQTMVEGYGLPVFELRRRRTVGYFFYFFRQGGLKQPPGDVGAGAHISFFFLIAVTCFS